MPHGCLKDYLSTYNDKIPTRQRLQWVREAAEGLQLLHSANVIHCDVEPRNFLLDAELSLKIADFSSSSLEGSQASACVGTRFLPPDFNWCSLPTVQQDLYSFGSTIYNIMTGKPPFQELPSDKVRELYKGHQFPDVTGLLCGEIIERRWRCEIASAQEISKIHSDYRDGAANLLTTYPNPKPIQHSERRQDLGHKYASIIAVLKKKTLALRVSLIFVDGALGTALGLAHSLLLRVLAVHTFTFSLRAPYHRVGRYIA
jgi:serine/threonine protein kinase